MSPRDYKPVLCVNCQCPASGKHALPIGDNGDIVPVGYTGEWAGQAACKMCHDLHEAAGENGPAVLIAYERNTVDMYNALEAARAAFATIVAAADDAETDLRHMSKSGPQ